MRSVCSGAAALHNAVRTPHSTVRPRMATPIQMPRANMSRLKACPVRARIHSDPIATTATSVARFLRPEVSGETPVGEGDDRDSSRVVSDQQAREGPEQQALDQRDGGGDGCRARTERLFEAADKATRNEERPAFDINGADHRRQERPREDEPSCRVAKGGPGDAGDEERGNPKLRDGRGSRLLHGDERQKGRGGQHDPHVMSRLVR